MLDCLQILMLMVFLLLCAPTSYIAVRSAGVGTKKIGLCGTEHPLFVYFAASLLIDAQCSASCPSPDKHCQSTVRAE